MAPDCLLQTEPLRKEGLAVNCMGEKGLPGERARVWGRWKQMVLVVLIVAVWGGTFMPSAWAEAAGQREGETASTGTPSGAALQAASWLVTLPYGAAKVGFALLGGVVGGLTYALSAGDVEAAKSVWTTTMYGTYVITPAHLKGETAVRFLGVQAEAPDAVKTASY